MLLPFNRAFLLKVCFWPPKCPSKALFDAFYKRFVYYIMMFLWPDPRPYLKDMISQKVIEHLRVIATGLVDILEPAISMEGIAGVDAPLISHMDIADKNSFDDSISLFHESFSWSRWSGSVLCHQVRYQASVCQQ